MCALNIVPYERRHHRAVSDLLFRGHRVFTHLDWHTTDQLLTSQNHLIHLAWQNNILAGVMGISLPISETCWLRLVALNDSLESARVLATLWDVLYPLARANHAHRMCVLQLEEWMEPYLKQLNFEHTDDIITLIRQGGSITPELQPKPMTHIRTALTSDTWAILGIDREAFSPPWQLSAEDMRYARRIASNSSIALLGDEIVGYQLSTSYQGQGHLARLAVRPQNQGNGIGTALVADMIQHFVQREITTITVNTQASNIRSQNLYASFGFQHNNQDLAFWQRDLNMRV